MEEVKKVEGRGRTGAEKEEETSRDEEPRAGGRGYGDVVCEVGRAGGGIEGEVRETSVWRDCDLGNAGMEGPGETSVAPADADKGGDAVEKLSGREA